MRYIGSKANLLNEIRSMVTEHAPESAIFCDIFAGTGIVGREFKSTHQLLCNDILYFSFVLNSAYNGLSKAPDFKKLSKVIRSHPIDFLNNISVRTSSITDEDFLVKAYSPAGNAKRQYLSVENAFRADRIRQNIRDWHLEGLISEPDSNYLLASLIEKVPSVSNIAGTYGAYLKHWDTRALKPLKLDHLDIKPTKYKNKTFNRDANSLVKDISGDVLYIDTPYNSRQYSSNYHLLESLARYDNPEIKGKTGTRVATEGQSDFCKKSNVYDSFDSLLASADFRSLVISYSSDGILSEDQLRELATKNGKESTLKFKKIPYRRYKRTAEDKREVLEYLIAIDK